MLSDLETLATVVAASVTTSTALGLLLHELLKRWLGSRFDREIESLKAKHAQELAHLQAQLASRSDAERRITQLGLDAVPRICETAYRAKKDTIDLIDSSPMKEKGAVFGRALKKLAQKNGQALADLCIQYCWLLPLEEFKLLHSYKELHEQLGVAAAVFEQTPASDEAVANIATLRRKMEAKFEAVAQAFRSDRFLRQH